MNPDTVAELFVLLDRKAQLLYDIGRKEARIEHLETEMKVDHDSRLRDSHERAQFDLAELRSKLVDTERSISLGLAALRSGS